MSLKLPDGEECFWNPTHECDGWHADEHCDEDPCDCPDDVGHRSAEGLAAVEAERKAFGEAQEREWASYEAMSKHGHGGNYCFEVGCKLDPFAKQDGGAK